RVRQPAAAQHRPARTRAAPPRDPPAGRLHARGPRAGPGDRPEDRPRREGGPGMTALTTPERWPLPAARLREPVLEVRHLSVDYGYDEQPTHVLRDVSLTLHRGEVLGLAGESGCGKST